MRGDRNGDWKFGLVRFSNQIAVVFPDSVLANNVRTLHRQKMTGYTSLDAKRASSIDIQPSLAAFRDTFHYLSDGSFKGLDWSNIFVAGGIILGTLLCTDLEADGPKYKESDIDVYIYGLGPIEANEKITHVYNVEIKPSFWLACYGRTEL